MNFNEGDMRVWWCRGYSDTDRPMTYIPVATPEAAIPVLQELADNDLKNAEVYFNAGGLMVFEGNDWCEWYNDEGEDIDDYAERLADEKS